MKLVLRNGEIKEVDTTHIFDNQYNTTDGKRVPDREVKYIIDDIRLGEFYCSSVKQGTYDEVAEAIAEERAKINKCDGCWWFHERTLLKDESSSDRQEIKDGEKKIVVLNEKRVYKISCAYMPQHGSKCVHDIEEKPILFRENNYCFFCEYPQGLPDMKPLKEFMIANADKYGIVPCWASDKLSIENSFMYDKLFGSYRFVAHYYREYFELKNARNHFKFYVDFVNKKFILDSGIGYEVVDKLTEHKCEYDHSTKQHKSYDEPIKNYDKFAIWLWQIVDDFNEQKEE
jgi:hypothetical protein